MTAFTNFLVCPQLVISLNASHADSGRIINGQDVPDGRYPMMVSLQYMKSPCDYSNGYEPFCGGTIVNDNTILT